MHSHQFEWLVSPEGLFWHSGTTTRALSLPGLQYIWTPPLPWNSFSHLEPVAEGETITCPCPQGLTLSQSLGANTSPYWSWDKKPHQTARLLTTVLGSFSQCTCVSVACYTQHCRALAVKTMLFSLHVVLVWPVQGVSFQGRWVTLWLALLFALNIFLSFFYLIMRY